MALNTTKKYSDMSTLADVGILADEYRVNVKIKYLMIV
jgi:hypothetical protein